jgi:hypothetical protein
MALDDALENLVEPEVGLLAAAAVVLLSPPVRRALRQGAVYGLSGLLAAGDAIAALGRRVDQGVHPPAEPVLISQLAAEARDQRAKLACPEQPAQSGTEGAASPSDQLSPGL